MPDWFADMIGMDALDSPMWIYMINYVSDLLSKSPEQASPNTWRFIRDSVYPYFSVIGATLLNLFCLIGFVRTISNLKENVTIEMWIELCVKLIVGNVLIQNGMSLMGDLLEISTLVTKNFIPSNGIGLITGNVDVGFVLAYIVFGLLYYIVVAVCSVMIAVEVLGRYLNLYILMGISPIALSTLAGGHGIENTAYAWIKSFFTTCFQIILIALILCIGGAIVNGGFGRVFTGIGGWFDGFGDMLESCVFMILMTTAIKGSDNLLKRAFDLR